MKTARMTFTAFASAAISMVSLTHVWAVDTVRVTPETYIRAESDRQFGEVVKMAGGVNRTYHFRSLTPLVWRQWWDQKVVPQKIDNPLTETTEPIIKVVNLNDYR